MQRMKITAIPAILAALCAVATAAEPAMREALLRWEQQMTEYNAALKVARTDEQRAAVKVPDGRDIASDLWLSISRKTGEREEWVRPTAEERMHGAVDERKMVPVYEFDQPWAAPAVVWFINHPEAFAQMFNGKARRVSYYANALLESLNRTHYTSAAVGNACAKLSESQSVRVYELLQKIYTRNQDFSARAKAALAMCIMLNNPTISGAEGSAAMARSKQVYFLRQAVRLAPENDMFGTRSVSETVIEMSYILRNLSVGSIPPRLTVTAMDGKPATFPEKGKPTLIFFWSTQERLGLNVVQKQHQLAEQFPGLVFCPITVHGEMGAWKQELNELGIVANCFMDDEQNSNGQAYRVSQLPTAVLVGADSRILFIGYPGLPLQTALESLFTKEKGPRVTVSDEAPVLQPGSQPTPAQKASDEVPALRDMPDEF